MNAQDFSTTVFDLAPVAMWLEDFSGVKEQFELWRAEGVTDLRSHLLADRDQCAPHDRKRNRIDLIFHEEPPSGELPCTP